PQVGISAGIGPLCPVRRGRYRRLGCAHYASTQRTADLATVQPDSWPEGNHRFPPSVPMLVLHGDADQVLPLDKTGQRLPGRIKYMELVVIEGGPHAIAWTHAGQVNTALLDFLRS